jgi:uncharacterized radical SAM superfamily Fe-S cluster-containing enzyme
MQLKDYTFLSTTQSLCPECLALVPAKIIERGGRVYFRKRCPEHGEREDFVCSDVRWYDRLEFSVPGRPSREYGVEPDKGCPFDCGLCTEHEQHTCVGLVEVTSSCNLTCPMCYSSSAPGGKHLSLAECQAAIDRLVEVEGRAEVLQLSGGEPTIHPQLMEIVEYAYRQPIDIIMINTNGIRLANDDPMLERLAEYRERLEIYLQFDGFDDRVNTELRGEPLVETKLRAVEKLGRHRLRCTLVCTLQPGVNDDQVGRLVQYAIERPWITGVSFQPATYSGRHVLPEQIESRITFPDVIEALVAQCDGLFEPDDFMPLPCAHPNCHSLAYLYRHNGHATPLTRFIDFREHFDLLANGLMFNKPRARQIIEQFLGRQGCCAGGDCSGEVVPLEISQLTPPGINAPQSSNGNGDGRDSNPVGVDFLNRAVAEQLAAADVLRITITSFLDAYNFDVRRLMKCCIHHVLPSGHVIPFCAYNVLYRDGHVPLPEMVRAIHAAR